MAGLGTADDRSFFGSACAPRRNSCWRHRIALRRQLPSLISELKICGSGGNLGFSSQAISGPVQRSCTGRTPLLHSSRGDLASLRSSPLLDSPPPPPHAAEQGPQEETHVDSNKCTERAAHCLQDGAARGMFAARNGIFSRWSPDNHRDERTT